MQSKRPVGCTLCVWPNFWRDYFWRLPSTPVMHCWLKLLVGPFFFILSLWEEVRNPKLSSKSPTRKASWSPTQQPMKLRGGDIMTFCFPASAAWENRAKQSWGKRAKQVINALSDDGKEVVESKWVSSKFKQWTIAPWGVSQILV